ncbi:MAG: hypothetical protein HOP08_06995 [Cyclobacteriaceae bacterium]|nr:hypothetical protein [Cyclobacteriaceae bacterium]
MKSTVDHSVEKSQTLYDCLVKAVERGYYESFRVSDQGLITQNGKKIYTAEEVMISDVCRFDQSSNSKDHSVLYQLETIDGRKGTLIDAYGSYANEKLISFIRHVRSVPKNSAETKSPTNFFGKLLMRLKLVSA